MAEQYTSTVGTEQQSSRLFSRAPERAILVGVEMPGADWTDRADWPVEESLNELEQLARTAGVETADRVTQRLARPHPGTLLGSGKIEEIAELVSYHNCDGVIFDLELSPGQHRNLERALDVQVLDRTALILMTSPAARTPRQAGKGGRHGRARI